LANDKLDTGQFDGSADPNPGGRLGWGWHLSIGGMDLPPQGGSRPPAPQNTNNLGEYMGLISLLEDYIAQGGKGPLEVRGDSQLVIKQVLKEYKCRTPHLVPLLARVHALVRQIPGGVRFVWVRRSLNAVADAAAAGGGPKQDGSFRESWANQTELGKQMGLSAVAVGRKLKELGLRDAQGAATDAALRDGYCKSTPLKNGTPFFMWNVRKVTALLGK
jgi:ribonuclease HI